LENLKANDAIFEAGFTVSGTEEGQDLINIRTGERLPVKRKWRLTYGGDDRVAFLMEMTDHEIPKFDGPPDKRLTKIIRTKEWGYWGHDLCGTHVDDTIVEVSPGGKEKPTGGFSDSFLYPPRANGPLAPRQELVLSLGRFYSQMISKVTRVERKEGGRLAVSALGNLEQNKKGRWELEIDPAAAWMVRKARFCRGEAPNQIRLEMKNEGAVWSESRCIPTAATINVLFAPGSVDTKHLAFQPSVGPFDEELCKNAEQTVAHNTDPELTVHDNRNGMTFYEPNRPKPKAKTEEKAAGAARPGSEGAAVPPAAPTPKAAPKEPFGLPR